MTESQRKAMEQAIYAMDDTGSQKQQAAISALFTALAEPAPVQEPAKKLWLQHGVFPDVADFDADGLPRFYSKESADKFQSGQCSKPCTGKNCGSMNGWMHSIECRAEHEAVNTAPVQEPHKDLADAYCGAREDLAIWKKRALEAESELRNEIDSSHRLISELNAQNGPSHMGDPVCKPVQEPVGKGLFVDLIAQHPGLAEELKAIDDAPLPAWIPPRLTDGELNELYSKWAMGKRDGTTFTDVIQDAVRSQFASQQPRKAVKLSDEQVGMLTVFDGLHHVEVPLLAEFIRAVEEAVLKANGDKE